MSSLSSNNLKLQHKHKRTASILDLYPLETFKCEVDPDDASQDDQSDILVIRSMKEECTLHELSQLMVKITKLAETEKLRVEEKKKKIRSKVLRLCSSNSRSNKPKLKKSKIFVPILSQHKLPLSSQNTSASGKKPCSNTSRHTRKSHSSTSSMRTPPKKIKNLLQGKKQNPGPFC